MEWNLFVLYCEFPYDTVSFQWYTGFILCSIESALLLQFSLVWFRFVWRNHMKWTTWMKMNASCGFLDMMISNAKYLFYLWMLLVWMASFVCEQQLKQRICNYRFHISTIHSSYVNVSKYSLNMEDLPLFPNLLNTR